jgi:hypothetical protein
VGEGAHLRFSEAGFASDWSADILVRSGCGLNTQTSEQLGYGDPSNGEFKSLAVLLHFLRFLLFSPQKAAQTVEGLPNQALQISPEQIAVQLKADELGDM